MKATYRSSYAIKSPDLELSDHRYADSTHLPLSTKETTR
jgi:hypothetical protein